MTTGDTIETSSDDRVMAAVAHFFGLFGGLIVWATQKDRSRFVKFQALQAMAFGALLSVAMMIFMLCVMLVIALSVAGVVLASVQSGAPGDNVAAVAMLWPLSFFCIMPVSFAASIVQVAAAISVATGHNWRYPLIAPRVEAWMEKP